MAADTEAQKAGSIPGAEWERGRAKIDECDARIDSIRKQGLAYVTGLLAIESALGTDLASGSLGPELRAQLGYAVLVFSLIVIITIRFFERQQHMLQSAAASRCLVLEAGCSTELTEIIHSRFALQHWPVMTLLIYGGFGAVACVLFGTLSGTAAQPVWPKPETAIVVFAAILAWLTWADLRPTWVPGLDWSVESLAVRTGDPVRVRVVNLTEAPRVVRAAPRLLRVPFERGESPSEARSTDSFIRERDPTVRGALVASLALWVALWSSAALYAAAAVGPGLPWWLIPASALDAAVLAALALRQNGVHARLMRERLRGWSRELSLHLSSARRVTTLVGLALLCLVAIGTEGNLSPRTVEWLEDLGRLGGYWWAYATVGTVGLLGLLALTYRCSHAPIRDRIELDGWPTFRGWESADRMLPLLPPRYSFVWELRSDVAGTYAIAVQDDSGEPWLLDKKPVVLEREPKAAEKRPDDDREQDVLLLSIG